MTVALGIVTMNRPAYLGKVAKAYRRNLITESPVFDYLYCYGDGSSPKFRGEYGRSYGVLESIGATVIDAPENRGVAHAKNALLYVICKETDADWIILAEDDILPQSPEAVTGYIAAAEASGLSHLSYALHGPANLAGPVDADDNVAYYFHSIGAWCLYSRECLEDVGGFDENFRNAWEHVELTLRLGAAGYTSGAYRYADALHSSKWLSEIPGSIEKSSIPVGIGRQAAIRNGLLYWRDAKPDTYALLFGPGTPLEAYAHSVIG